MLGSYGSAKWGVAAPTSNAVHLFNSFVHKFILIALHKHVERALEHGEQAKFAIEHLMICYGWRGGYSVYYAAKVLDPLLGHPQVY